MHAEPVLDLVQAPTIALPPETLTLQSIFFFFFLKRRKERKKRDSGIDGEENEGAFRNIRILCLPWLIAEWTCKNDQPGRATGFIQRLAQRVGVLDTVRGPGRE